MKTTIAAALAASALRVTVVGTLDSIAAAK
jgi:hypothetical protein